LYNNHAVILLPTTIFSDGSILYEKSGGFMAIKENGKINWFGYAAEFLTLLFAIAVLAGRIYAQSYWKVFGLSPDLVDVSLINYAIVSPNIAIASVMMAISSVAVIAIFRRQIPDFVGDGNPRVVYSIGWVVFWLGVFTIGIVLKINTSSWVPGTAGLVMGLGYLGFMGGSMIWMQAGARFENQQKWKWELEIIRFLKKIPFVIFQLLLIVGFAGTSIWAITDTAQKFGSNEAKEMYITSPVVSLQLDSIRGFEDTGLIPNSAGAILIDVKLLAKTDDFLYVSNGGSVHPLQIYVRAIPTSRVQAIRYSVPATPIGK